MKEEQFFVWPNSVQIRVGYHVSVLRKRIAEVIVCMSVDIFAVLFGERTAQQIMNKKSFSFRMNNTKFLKFGYLRLCSVEKWKILPISFKQLRKFWSLKTKMKSSEQTKIWSYVINEDTIPIRSRNENFCSLAAKTRELYEIPSIFPLIFIWNNTEPTTIKKDLQW